MAGFWDTVSGVALGIRAMGIVKVMIAMGAYYFVNPGVHALFFIYIIIFISIFVVVAVSTVESGQLLYFCSCVCPRWQVVQSVTYGLERCRVGVIYYNKSSAYYFLYVLFYDGLYVFTCDGHRCIAPY